MKWGNDVRQIIMEKYAVLQNKKERWYSSVAPNRPTIKNLYSTKEIVGLFLYTVTATI